MMKTNNITNQFNNGVEQVNIEKDITIILTRPLAIKKEELDLFCVFCNASHEYNSLFTIFEYPPCMIPKDQEFKIVKFENNEMIIKNDIQNTSKEYIEQYKKQKLDKKKNINYDSFFFVRFNSLYEQSQWEIKIKQIRRWKRIIKKLINQYLRINKDEIKMEDVIQKFKEELKKEDSNIYKDRKDDIIIIL